MGKTKIENTRDLRSWVDKGEISEAEKEAIEDTIKAFSDYITAVDTEYLYNKSFLKGFIPAFIRSNEMLNRKKEFVNDILNRIGKYKSCIRIEIDNAWIFNGKDDKLILANAFSKTKVNSEKACYQIKYVDDKKSFAIAGRFNIDKSEEEIENAVELFLSRMGENNGK